jgi:hypothetical protein
MVRLNNNACLRLLVVETMGSQNYWMIGLIVNKSINIDQAVCQAFSDIGHIALATFPMKGRSD